VNTSYEDLLAHVLEHGSDKMDRTGTGTRSPSLLTHMVAQQVAQQVGELIWTGGDCPIYDNHVVLRMRRAVSLFDYEPTDVQMLGYVHHPSIRAVIAV